ncbi:flavodoxin domain-containing protein [Streptomyces sp. ODS28]|uniref:flavodoxin domain-containing protein n=1 Tax=Streptomyces sp. ODS28 TaxID=3136688 RepID=UPI0031E92C89
MEILLGYASEHGSTRQIAERLAARLQERGHSVDLRSLETRPSAEEYPAVVLGSAVHSGAWLPPAAEFVRRYRDALGSRPVWMFSVGMTAALPRPLRRLASRSEQPAIARLRETLDPRDYHRFSGAIRPAHLNRTGRVIFRLLGCRYGDFRDEGEIDAWGVRIARQMQ